GLQEGDQDDGLRKFLLRERAFLLSRGPDYRRSYFFLRPLAMRQFTDRLENLASLIEASRWPWPRRLDAPKQVSEWSDRQRDTWRLIDESRFDGAARTLAMLRAARVVVAVARYRLDHSRLPQTLNDLVPPYLSLAPIDPYTGKAMLLAIERDAYVGYS